jgi:hypothetical protein
MVSLHTHSDLGVKVSVEGGLGERIKFHMKTSIVKPT